MMCVREEYSRSLVRQRSYLPYETNIYNEYNQRGLSWFTFKTILSINKWCKYDLYAVQSQAH